jgi:RNA polymerase sigma factor (sigma-70 family)
MTLTPAEEGRLVSQYAAELRRISMPLYRTYRNKYGVGVTFDDVYQEVLIEFLYHIRNIESEDQIYPLPYFKFRLAVCRIIMRSLPVTVPIRTTDFSKRIREYSTCCSIDDMIERGYDFSGGIDRTYSEVNERVSFQKFLDECSYNDANILIAYRDLGNMAEVGKRLNINKSTVSRTIERLKKKYLADCRKMQKNSISRRKEDEFYGSNG